MSSDNVHRDNSNLNFINLPNVTFPSASLHGCLDYLPLSFFSRSHYPSLGLCSKRHLKVFFSLLLFLSGDVHVNPGPFPNPFYSFCSLNVCSATSVKPNCDKPLLLQEFITDNNFDCMFLTETWLKPDTPSPILNSITPPNYSFIHVPRSSGRNGGGVGCLYKSIFSVSSLNVHSFLSFEHMLLRVTHCTMSFLFAIIYRPPDTPHNQFLADLSELLEVISSSPSELIIMGDFNIHVESPSDNFASSFLSLIESFDLKQHINSPTHKHGHTLDLIITRNASSILSSTTHEPFLSDHSAISCNFSAETTIQPTRTTKTYRKISSINLDQLSADIYSSSLYSNLSSNLEEYTRQFSAVLSTLLDKHAPTKTTTCRTSQPKPFINAEILQQKKIRSKLETAYRKNKTPENKSSFKKQSKMVAKLVIEAKRNYFRKIIDENKFQPRKLWSSLNCLLSRKAQSILPNSLSDSDLATAFNEFFDDKISKLCSNIPISQSNAFDYQSSSNSPSNMCPTSLTLSSFTSATPTEIRQIILNSNDSTCLLDNFPTKLLKSCLNALLPPITHLINLALSEGSFPGTWKSAIVRPLIKKPTLPKDNLSNYRPISNLSFISKILEKVIYSRLCSHLDSFQSLSPFQSAYRRFHSTETALTKIHNDLTLAINRRQVSALILLDLSAAFDTINHSILIQRLRSVFGISGSALSILSSYLTDRSQSVLIGKSLSSEIPLSRGVPQGSVLGPLLFSLYTTPLSHILNESQVQFHMYADDTQLYVSFSGSDSNQALSSLSSVLDRLYYWFCDNKLSINPSKTEFLLVGTPQQRSKVADASVSFRNLKLSHTESARNLGNI